MGLRPATPGFIVTLIATILLAVVSFNVPILKSVYFLQATLSVDNVNGTISLGTLGYCIDLSNGTTCSSPSVGYAFDPNALLGDNIKFAQIPTVVVKWITYALFLHVIALCAAAASALFGLLAHVREMSMTYCSTCISGLAAVVTLVAFVFDIVLFFVVKERVKSIDGTATFGSAVWLTLAAWVLLFFSGCVYACGRCCARRRPRGGDGRMDDSWMNRFAGNGNGDNHAEQMRLDAVKAEADRKARQKNEVGLPAFPEHADVVRPLKDIEDGSDEEAHSPSVPYRDHNAVGAVGGPRRRGSASTAGQTYRGGYAQAMPGTRAVDEYYSPSSPPPRSTAGGVNANTGYPPNRRQYSGSSSAQQSAYHSPSPGVAAAGVGAGGAAAYLAAGQSGHGQYPSAAGYGHANGGSTYHTAASSQHQQYPSAYSQYNDPYGQPQPQQSAFNAETYNQTAALPGAYGSSATPPPRQPSQPYADPYSGYAPASPTQHQQQQAYGDYNYNSTSYGDPYAANSSANYGYGYAGAAGHAQPQPQHQTDRSYTLGGGGYGGNVVPDSSSTPSPYGAPQLTSSPPPMPSVSAISSGGGGGPMGPRSPQAQPQPQSHQSSYEDSPPGYDSNAAPSVHVAEWGSKGGMHNISR